jgi:hypothetical protein
MNAQFLAVGILRPFCPTCKIPFGLGFGKTGELYACCDNCRRYWKALDVAKNLDKPPKSLLNLGAQMG